MGEKITSRVGFLIKNFRLAAGMTQKELAEKCGLNESTIRNYELGNRYPDNDTLLNIANSLNVSYYALSDPNIEDMFSVLHMLFNMEWTYGLRPTKENGEVVLKFDNEPSHSYTHAHKDMDAFKEMLTHWAELRDKLEKKEITEQDYLLKELRFPDNNAINDKNSLSSLDLDKDGKFEVAELWSKFERPTEQTGETTWNHAYFKRKPKPKKGE